MTTHWKSAAHEAKDRHDAVREMLAAEITALHEANLQLISEVESMRARSNAWRDTARQGVRLVEHITVTQSTDGQWPKIRRLYECFDNLHDAELGAEFGEIDAEDRSSFQQARRKAARKAAR